MTTSQEISITLTEQSISSSAASTLTRINLFAPYTFGEDDTIYTFDIPTRDDVQLGFGTPTLFGEYSYE